MIKHFSKICVLFWWGVWVNLKKILFKEISVFITFKCKTLLVGQVGVACNKLVGSFLS